MKSPETRYGWGGSSEAATAATRDPSPHRYDLLVWIATEALNKARERGHTPGYEQADWVVAESEVLARTYGMTGSSC